MTWFFVFQVMLMCFDVWVFVLRAFTLLCCVWGWVGWGVIVTDVCCRVHLISHLQYAFFFFPSLVCSLLFFF